MTGVKRQRTGSPSASTIHSPISISKAYKDCKEKITYYQERIKTVSDEIKKLELKETRNDDNLKEVKADIDRLDPNVFREEFAALLQVRVSVTRTGETLTNQIASNSDELKQLQKSLEQEREKLKRLEDHISPSSERLAELNDCLVEANSAASYVASLLSYKDRERCFKNVVFGGTSPFTYFRPSVVQRILDQACKEELVSAAKFSIRQGYLSSLTMAGFSETNLDTSVKSVLDPALNNFFATSASSHPLYLVQEPTMLSLDAGLGYVSPNSQPDMMVCCQFLDNPVKVPLCVIERKPTYTGTIEAGGQAVAEACNVALLHRWKGVPANEVAVPFILTNGVQYQFGFVTLLDEIYPAAHLVTVTLDAFAFEEQIATLLAQIKDFCCIQGDLLSKASPDLERPTSSVVVRLDGNKYFQKPWGDVNRRGELTPEKAMFHLHSVFEKLKDLEDVVKPIGFTSMSAPSEGEYFVFPRVDTSTYKLGIPKDHGVFVKYMSAFKALLKNVHAAGVAHMDLYPSNVFWRENGDTVQIKLIDWDTATFIGNAIPEEMKAVRQKYPWKCLLRDTAVPECDAWFLYICSVFAEDERQGLSGVMANDVNGGYDKALDKLKVRINFDDLLVGFDEWFATVWSA